MLVSSPAVPDLLGEGCTDQEGRNDCLRPVIDPAPAGFGGGLS